MRIILLFFMVFCAATSVAKTDKLLIITNDAQLAKEVSTAQLRSLYLGGSTLEDVQLVSFNVGHPLRLQFNAKIIGMTEAKVRGLRAQLRFSGRAKGSEPTTCETQEQLMAMLSGGKKMIAYVSADMQLPEFVSIIDKI